MEKSIRIKANNYNFEIAENTTLRVSIPHYQWDILTYLLDEANSNDTLEIFKVSCISEFEEIRKWLLDKGFKYCVISEVEY